MTLHTGDNAVVIAAKPAVKRVFGADGLLYGGVAAGADVIKVCVTLSHDGFPDQHLRCHRLCQCCGVSGVLGTPRGADGTRVAVLHDAPDKQLHFVGRDGAVEICGQVVPKGFVLAGVAVAGFLRRSRLDAVADVALIRVHRSDGGILGVPGVPAVHILEIRVSPRAAVIEIGVSASRKGNEVDLRLLSCGKGGGRAKPHKGGQAHHEGKQSCHPSLEKVSFHWCFSSL